jgi:Cellulose binding domain
MRQKPFFLLVLLVGSCATPIEQGAGTVSTGGANPSSAGSPNSAGSIASGGATGNAGATNDVDPLGAGGLPAGAGGTATDSGGAAGMDPGAGGDGGGGRSGSGGQSDAGGSAGSAAGSGTAGGAGKAGNSGASGTGNAGAGGVSGAGGRGNGGAAGVSGVAGAVNGAGGAGTAGVSGAGNGGSAGTGGVGGAAGAAGTGGAGGGACMLGTAFSAQFWTAAAPTVLPTGTFRITNNSGVDVSYGAIEVRYYLTNEETAALTPIFVTFNHFRPAGFSAGTIGNVHGSYLPLTPAASGANTYLSITVLGGEGSFVAGENSVIGFYSSLAQGASKTNQTGDYSYDGHATADPGASGAPSSKVTLYVNGVLSWGCEP